MVDHALVEQQRGRGDHVGRLQAGKLLLGLVEQRFVHQPAGVEQPQVGGQQRRHGGRRAARPGRATTNWLRGCEQSATSFAAFGSQQREGARPSGASSSSSDALPGKSAQSASALARRGRIDLLRLEPGEHLGLDVRGLGRLPRGRRRQRRGRLRPHAGATRQQQSAAIMA